MSRTTIERKLVFLGAQAQRQLREDNLKHKREKIVVFDEMETFEHTKCKPLSIAIAVVEGTRRILGFEVSRMPASGLLAAISRKKYGARKDERSAGRAKLFQTLKGIVEDDAKFKSDQNPHYPAQLKEAFPNSTHETCKGRRGATTGQGELKKIGFDPIFSLNHTCAMTRANMNRLFRRTWCTTKLSERLAAHLAIYAVFHNNELLRT